MKSRNDAGKDEVTIISSGVVIEGKLSSNGNIRIDGTIKGNVSASGNITIGENGEVQGDVESEVINLGGKVTGSVAAREKLVLESKSVLTGDLTAKILVIEAGAKFDGSSSMSGKEKQYKAPVMQDIA